MIAFRNMTLECDGNRFTLSGWFDIDEAGGVSRIWIGEPESAVELHSEQAGYWRLLFESFACQLALAFIEEIAAQFSAQLGRAA